MEAVAVEVPVASMTLVEGLSVDPIQALHAVREPVQPRLDDQVEVIVEEDPRDAVPAVAAHRQAGEAGPVVAVVFIADDLLARDAAGRDVVDAEGGKRRARLPGHRARVDGRHAETRRCGRIVTLSFARPWPNRPMTGDCPRSGANGHGRLQHVRSRRGRGWHDRGLSPVGRRAPGSRLQGPQPTARRPSTRGSACAAACNACRPPRCRSCRCPGTPRPRTAACSRASPPAPARARCARPRVPP